MYEKHLINITLLVFVSMCSGDLTSENVLALSQDNHITT